MISIQNRITAFAKLGDFLSQFTINDIKKIDHIEHNEIFFDGFLHQIKLAEENNSWFTKNNILFSLEIKTCLMIGCDLEAINPTILELIGTSRHPIIFNFCFLISSSNVFIQ